ADNQKTLATSQRTWLKQRNACETMRYSSKTLKCLTDAYIQRIDELCTTYADVPACTRVADIQLP
ncbi:MAG: lysozyme inhibitor LprI family protein, partial [Azoarcus sp.]|nr:lysozyme inhibitor LprI family protein [Azoarcus sp.]